MYRRRLVAAVLTLLEMGIQYRRAGGTARRGQSPGRLHYGQLRPRHATEPGAPVSDDLDDPNRIPPPGRPSPWAEARQLAADRTIARWVRQRRDELSREQPEQTRCCSLRRVTCSA